MMSKEEDKPHPTVAATNTRDVLVQQSNQLASSGNTLLGEVRNSMLIGSVKVRSHKEIFDCLKPPCF